MARILISMRTVVVWEQFTGISYLSGQEAKFNPFLPKDSGWLLLHLLSAMPRRTPLTYQAACRMVQDEVRRQVDLGNNDPEVSGSANWLMSNWIKWLSDRGYHVELAGNEFEFVAYPAVI